LPSRRKIIAVIAGILLAGVPMAAFNYWIDGLVERRGQDEADQWARRSIAIAETRIQRVVATLDKLAASGVDSCSDEHIDALRHATFATNPIKALMVVDPDGRTLCSDLGLPLQSRLLVSQPLTGADQPFFFEVMQVSGRADRLVRIRRQAIGSIGIAALVPSELFMAIVSARGAVLPALARTTLQDGTLVGEGQIPHKPSDMAGPLFTATQSSSRYGLSATISLPKSAIGDGTLRTFALATTCLAALLIAVFALLLPRRQRNNPVADLEEALKAGEFIPYYQPIVDITSGRLRGAEVLIRWRKPDGSLIAPANFIPLAESSGLITAMTHHVMNMARDELQAAYASRPQLRLAFNLAASEFADSRVVQDLQSIFERSPIQYSQIILELTERQPVADLAVARGVIAAMQQLGVKVAVDDVGSGHAGLSYMLKLGADVIKIDKAFIDAVGSESNSMRVIETLVDLANNMRMEIIAEGVESFDQVVALRKYGVRLAQGYVFAPPLPGSSFLQLVDAIEPLTGVPAAKLPVAA
jgi:sensor c-di-GMP phosphodiesterase-like protein